MSAPSVLAGRAVPLLSVVAAVFIWEAAVRLLAISPDKLPPPSTVVATIVEDRAHLLQAVVVTLYETSSSDSNSARPLASSAGSPSHGSGC